MTAKEPEVSKRGGGKGRVGGRGERKKGNCRLAVRGFGVVCGCDETRRHSCILLAQMRRSKRWHCSSEMLTGARQKAGGGRERESESCTDFVS
eukprot:3138380-Rhodomonas_salina.3